MNFVSRKDKSEKDRKSRDRDSREKERSKENGEVRNSDCLPKRVWRNGPIVGSCHWKSVLISGVRICLISVKMRNGNYADMVYDQLFGGDVLTQLAFWFISSSCWYTRSTKGSMHEDQVSVKWTVTNTDMTCSKSSSKGKVRLNMEVQIQIRDRYTEDSEIGITYISHKYTSCGGSLSEIDK